MALPVVAGRPLSAKLTAEGGAAVTIAYIKSVEVIDDPELIEEMAGNSQVPYYWQGKLVRGIKIVTSDLAAYSAFPKGTCLSAGEIEMEGARYADGTKVGPSTVVKMEITDGVITEAVPLKVDASGKPAEFEITAMIAHGQAGDAGTATKTVTTSSGGGS